MNKLSQFLETSHRPRAAQEGVRPHAGDLPSAKTPPIQVLHQNAVFTGMKSVAEVEGRAGLRNGLRANNWASAISPLLRRCRTAGSCFVLEDASRPERRGERMSRQHPISWNYAASTSPSTACRSCTASISTSAEGEALGLVGESGCGKSVTWLAALGLLPGKASVCWLRETRRAGIARCTARCAGAGARRARRDDLPGSRRARSIRCSTIGRQITEALSLHRGLRGRGGEGRSAAADGYGRHSRCAPPFRSLSARILRRPVPAADDRHGAGRKPDLLIADEPTTALDATIQAQILELLIPLRAETGMAMVLISHDLGAVSQVLRARLP